MRFYQIDPTQDVRWSRFIQTHANASIFHTVGWLQALRKTYGYEPVVFTTSSARSELKNGLVFCRIKSWLTGRRLVSLPFSDHCEPLYESVEDLQFLIRYLKACLEQQGLKYLEIRPVDANFGQTGASLSLSPAALYSLHILDLRPELRDLFGALDRDSIQRRIQRADRAALVEKCGRSDDLLKDFYTLFVITRARHGVPPVPISWFHNLIDGVGESVELRLAYTNGRAIAGILTLQFRDRLYYKYGCSDTRFKKLGATPWLFWRAITQAKSNGITKFDMGRTEHDNPGLLRFKNHWVPRPERLTYWKFPNEPSFQAVVGWKSRATKRALAFMPLVLKMAVGKIAYRHVG